jgi:hypothetical protein
MVMVEKDSQCPVTRGEVDLEYYESVDGNWRALGLSAPARRALVNDNLFKLEQLSSCTRTHISNLHGMGPHGVRILEAALSEKKISFKQK